MKQVWLVLGLLLVVTSTVAVAMSLDDALGLFSGGADPVILYSLTGKAQLEGSIAAFEAAIGVPVDFDYTSGFAYMSLSIPEGKKDLVNKLAQCYYVLGDVFTPDATVVKAVFVRGNFWGLKSLRMGPTFAETEKEHGFVAAVKQETDVAALYWTCANWGRVDQYDKLAAIGHYDPPKLLALIERSLAVDNSYMVYGAYRVLAGFWGGFPKIPLIKYRQNLPRVLSYICHVIDASDYCGDVICNPAACCDEYLENRRTFVTYYLLPKRRWQEAANVLNEIISAEVGDKYPLYNAFAQQEARTLLGKVQKHL